MKIVFCNGQPKSGSTFFFNLVKRLMPCEELLTTNERLRLALASNDAAHRILYRELGEYTGFVDGSIAGAARAFAKLSLPIESRLIVKMHDPDPVPALQLPGEHMIITTFRDPLDVMMALFDQADRERFRPAGTLRPAFMARVGYAKALEQTEKFVARLVRSFSPHNWYLEYPSFIHPSPDQADTLAAILGVDAQNILTTAAKLDRDIRAGAVSAEFNRGEAGRGRQIIDELVWSGSVSRRLVQRAISRHRELVELVSKHRRGLTVQGESSRAERSER